MGQNTYELPEERWRVVEHDLDFYSQHCIIRCDGEQTRTFDDPDESVDVDIGEVEDGPKVKLLVNGDMKLAEDSASVQVSLNESPVDLDCDDKCYVYLYGTLV